MQHYYRKVLSGGTHTHKPITVYQPKYIVYGHPRCDEDRCRLHRPLVSTSAHSLESAQTVLEWESY